MRTLMATIARRHAGDVDLRGYAPSGHEINMVNRALRWSSRGNRAGGEFRALIRRQAHSGQPHRTLDMDRLLPAPDEVNAAVVTVAELERSVGSVSRHNPSLGK